MKQTLPIILTMVVLLTCSCSDNQNDKVNDSTQYYPKKITISDKIGIILPQNYTITSYQDDWLGFNPTQEVILKFTLEEFNELTLQVKKSPCFNKYTQEEYYMISSDERNNFIYLLSNNNLIGYWIKKGNNYLFIEPETGFSFFKNSYLGNANEINYNYNNKNILLDNWDYWENNESPIVLKYHIEASINIISNTMHYKYMHM